MATLESMPRAQISTPVVDHGRWLGWLTALSFGGFLVGLYMALVYAGTDINMGPIQRIFYMHVAAFAGATAAFFAAVVGGIMYLRTRQIKWDVLGLSGVEVGLTLSVITLLTGMIWARPTWNTWWTWDPRLTSTAIMALTYTAYLMLRSGIDNPDLRRRFASVYSVLAIGTVLFTIFVIRFRGDTIHPTVILAGESEGSESAFLMGEGMKAALMVNLAVWILLITPVLVWWRVRLENLSESVAVLKAQRFLDEE